MRAYIPRLGATLLLASLGSPFLLVGNSSAQLPPAGDAPGPKPTKAEAPEISKSDGPVQWLPSTAYPEWTNRGIVGGSLRLSASMHGMQWPYYPSTGIGISGGAWLDTGYETIKSTNAAQPGVKYLLNQGRAWLRVTPTYTGDSFFAQTQVELVGNKDQAISQPSVVDVDDLWLRVGQWKKWDVQIGRFEALEVYHFGLALDLNTLERQGPTDSTKQLPDVYGLSTIVYRQNGVGNLALHLYPGEHIRIEALGQFGYDSLGLLSTVGGRLAGVVDYGWVKFKASGDARTQFPVKDSSKESRTQHGGSGALQFVAGPFAEFGANVSYGLVDHYNALNTSDPNASQGDYDAPGSNTTWSAGGFANVRIVDNLVFGAGANAAFEDDQASGHFNVKQGFAALQYVIGGRVYVKTVGAYATAHIDRGNVEPWDNTMVSGRLRLMYLY